MLSETSRWRQNEGLLSAIEMLNACLQTVFGQFSGTLSVEAGRSPSPNTNSQPGQRDPRRRANGFTAASRRPGSALQNTHVLQNTAALAQRRLFVCVSYSCHHSHDCRSQTGQNRQQLSQLCCDIKGFLFSTNQPIDKYNIWHILPCMTVILPYMLPIGCFTYI